MKDIFFFIILTSLYIIIFYKVKILYLNYLLFLILFIVLRLIENIFYKNLFIIFFIIINFNTLYQSKINLIITFILILYFFISIFVPNYEKYENYSLLLISFIIIFLIIELFKNKKSKNNSNVVNDNLYTLKPEEIKFDTISLSLNDND